MRRSYFLVFPNPTRIDPELQHCRARKANIWETVGKSASNGKAGCLPCLSCSPVKVELVTAASLSTMAVTCNLLADLYCYDRCSELPSIIYWLSAPLTG